MTKLEMTLDELLSAGPMAPVANPHPLYRKLRDESPVVTISSAIDGGEGDGSPGSVMITRYEDVRSTLKNDAVFSSAVNNRTMGIVMGPNIVGMDGREHLKHRALVTPALAPRALRGDFPGLVEKIAGEIVDRFASKGSADLRADYTFSYPLSVFVEILGLPKEDVDDFHDWGIDLTLVAHDPPKGLAASAKMLEYLQPIVERKREEGGTDLISSLANAEVERQRLTDLEVVSFLRLLVLAGAETTYHLMGSCLYALLQDRELMERIVADRSLIPKLMDETLRWESPIGTVMRETVQDTEIAGIEIAKGTNVLCHVGSANRDERRFPNPDVFDLDREDNEHIAFGFGKHYCAGSRLALLEGEIGLNVLLDRIQDIEPVPREEFHVIGFSFRGPDRLPVTFRAA